MPPDVGKDFPNWRRKLYTRARGLNIDGSPEGVIQSGDKGSSDHSRAPAQREVAGLHSRMLLCGRGYDWESSLQEMVS